MTPTNDPWLCKHPRRLLIAYDEEAAYWECLECGEIFEIGDQSPELTAAPATGNFNESLSDA